MIIEKVILDYLSEVLDVPVAMEKPEPAPDEYVLIMKTGGSTRNYINYATIAIQSLSTSLYKAALLNEAVKTAMQEAPDSLTDISKVELNGDYNYTDTAKKQYRYQSVHDIVFC